MGILKEQANSQNCGPRAATNLTLKKGQRSRSLHGANWKGMSQGPCMPNINAPSLRLQKIWARLKFLWQTNGRTDRGTDGQTDEWVLMSPAFAKAWGQLQINAWAGSHTHWKSNSNTKPAGLRGPSNEAPQCTVNITSWLILIASPHMYTNPTYRPYLLACDVHPMTAPQCTVNITSFVSSSRITRTSAEMARMASTWDAELKSSTWITRSQLIQTMLWLILMTANWPIFITFTVNHILFTIIFLIIFFISVLLRSQRTLLIQEFWSSHLSRLNFLLSYILNFGIYSPIYIWSKILGGDWCWNLL